jgi:hypothetical protein
MLRPTRFRLVTNFDIVPALHPCNLIKTKSSGVQIVGISGFAPWKAPDDWLTRGLWPRLQERFGFFGNVAGEWRCFNRGGGAALGLARNQASFRPKSLYLRLWRAGEPRGFAAPKNSISRPAGQGDSAGRAASRTAAIGTLIAW